MRRRRYLRFPRQESGVRASETWRQCTRRSTGATRFPSPPYAVLTFSLRRVAILDPSLPLLDSWLTRSHMREVLSAPPPPPSPLPRPPPSWRYFSPLCAVMYSPVPTCVMGAPVAATAERAPPPLAWPSSFVMMTEPTDT